MKKRSNKMMISTRFRVRLRLRDKGKAPVQATPVPEICEELAPSKAAELSREDPSSSRAREEAPIPDKEILIPEKETPNPETSFLEKDAQSAANEQLENQPDTEGMCRLAYKFFEDIADCTWIFVLPMVI
ncbi:hypothetical protein U1Q18_041957 [Sarracenia purpurea var. burkii]